MTEIAVSGAREHLAEVIEDARRSGEPIYVTKRGRPVAVILDPDVYENLLVEAEDATDRAELELARVENDFIPWEQVKVDLGLA
jgi:antitoxin Phd